MTELRILREPVATANLEQVASSRAAAQWHPAGSCVPLRTILWDVLACVDDGALMSVWNEERAGHLGRRYSGCPTLPAKATGELTHFKRLVASGVAPGVVGRSLFALPGCIRNLARADIPNLYTLDLVNAHVVITLRRHPSMAALAQYVNNRESTLAAIPAPRAAAKELFIRLLYGGKADTWCREHKVEPASLPAIVRAFEEDIAKVHTTDGGDAGTVQYLKNTEIERQAIDAIEALLISRGAWIHAYEHDGLCFSLLQADIQELVHSCSSACGFLVTVVQPPSLEECLRALRAKSGIDDWTPRGSDWAEREALVARARAEPLTSHALFARVVLNEPQVSDEVPWPVRELFRLCPYSRELHWFNASEGIWCDAAGGNGGQVLKEYATAILQRRLRTYALNDRSQGDRFRPDAVRWDLGCRAFREGVEACLRSHLIVAVDSVLDPEESRRYLNFGDRAWDRDDERWVDTHPGMLISRSTGWRYEPFVNAEAERVDRALAAIRAEQDARGIQESAMIPDDVQGELDAAAIAMPELRFFYDLVRDWDSVIYLLTHLARGAFGVPMAEALFVRSAGRSGKDSTANLMCAILGTYATSISCDALCAVPSPDAPSPTFASLRARRFVAIREVACQKMQSSVFKRFVDPVSELSGRNLYDAPVRFRPQYLAFFCSNAPIQMTIMDAAVKARMAVVDYSSVFTQTPTEANHRPWRDMSRAIIDYRPGVFWLLQAVYHHFLRDRPMRNVAPVPEHCMDAVVLNCREKLQDLGDGFIRDKLRAAKGPSDASLATDIEKAVASALTIDTNAVGLWLQARGFERIRRAIGGRSDRSNAYFYRYNFTVNGVKGLAPLYVRLA